MTTLDNIAVAISRSIGDYQYEETGVPSIECQMAARRAVEIILSPSGDMVIAGLKRMNAYGPTSAENAVIFGQPKEVWQAMAQAILDEIEPFGVADTDHGVDVA